MSGFLDALAAPLKGLLDGASKVIDSINAPKEQKVAALAQLQALQEQFNAAALQADSDFAKAQAGVVTSEAGGVSWMQRNWRPITMLSFVAILINNFIIAPYAKAFGASVPMLDIPTPMWGLLTVGIGGYIGARTYEKVQGVDTSEGNKGT